MCLSISIIVWLNKKNKKYIIKKFSKYNLVNIPSCENKYPDMYLFINFSSFNLGIFNDFLFIY
jgi:hypothetical protein